MTTTVTAPHVAVTFLMSGVHPFFLLLSLIFHRVLVQHGEMSNDPPLLMWKKVPQVSASLHPQFST